MDFQPSEYVGHRNTSFIVVWHYPSFSLGTASRTAATGPADGNTPGRRAAPLFTLPEGAPSDYPTTNQATLTDTSTASVRLIVNPLAATSGTTAATPTPAT